MPTTSPSTSTRCTSAPSTQSASGFIEENRESTRLMRNFTFLDQFDQQYFIYQNLSDYQGIEGSEHILGGPRTPWWERAKKLMQSVNKVSEEALDPGRTTQCRRTRSPSISPLLQNNIKPISKKKAISTSQPSRSKHYVSLTNTRRYSTKSERRSSI